MVGFAAAAAPPGVASPAAAAGQLGTAAGAIQSAMADPATTAGQPGTADPAAIRQPGAAEPGTAGRQHSPTTAGPNHVRGGAKSAGQPAAAPAQWKIQPLPGEPPLTLYRDKRLVMLPVGTEIDRYGEPNGNVTYAARTQYQHRSLPPEWSSYQYHVYRLQRPIEALTGFAVPWFDQPGGGTAFVLPGPISELLADGSLIEIGVQSPQQQPQPVQS